MSDTDTIVERLMDTLNDDKTLADRLQRPLVKAHELAEAELDPDQFSKLDWPTDLAEYDAYLKRFIR